MVKLVQKSTNLLDLTKTKVRRLTLNRYGTYCSERFIRFLESINHNYKP